MTARFLGVAGLLLSVGCGPTLGMRVPDAPVVQARLAAIPPFVRSFTYGASGRATDTDERGYEDVEHLNEALACRLSAHGGRFYDGPSLKGIDGMAELSLWGTRAMADIWRQSNGTRDVRYKNVGHYRFREDASDIREKLGADFLLLTFFIDGHNTTGRNVLNILSPLSEKSTARREAVACVVRLDDGRLVWCAFRRLDQRIDTTAGAQNTVDQMLEPLLHEGESGRLEEPEPCGRLMRPANLPSAAPGPVATTPTPSPPPSSPKQPAAPVPQSGDGESP